MELAVYVNDENKIDLCKKLIRSAGLVPNLIINYGDPVRSDLLIVAFFFGDSSLEEFYSFYPYSKLFVFTDHMVSAWRVPHARVFTSLEEIQDALHGLEKKEEKYLGESAVPERISNKRRNKKIICPHCRKDIGYTKFIYKNHLKSCEVYQNKPHAVGIMQVYRQENGRSRGSSLMVYIPNQIYVNDILFQPGFHLVTNGKIIKSLNAKLNSTYRYELVRNDVKD